MKIRAVIQEFLFEALQGQKQKRFEFLKQQFTPRWTGLPGYEDLDKFLEAVADIDPTKNGAYMQWIVQRIFKNPNENKVEDLPRLKKDLVAFEEHKAKIPNKDVNSYKTFYDLFAAIEPFTQPHKKSPSERAQARKEAQFQKMKEGIIDVHNGPEGWIKIPTTKAAACFLGQNTRWCTSARSNNMFDHYNKQDSLFVIYDKATKSRHQLHLTAGQFADVKDKTLPMKDVPQWARKPIIEWYKKNNPDLNIKQLMTLSGFGEEGRGLEKGTAHEELFDLMRKYGVM